MKKGLSRAERKAEKQRIKEEEKKKSFRLGLLLMGVALLICIGFMILDGKEDEAIPKENAAEEVTEEQVAVTADEPSAEEITTNEPALQIGNDINTVGDKVVFGAYEGKQIDWWVCETKEGKSLLVSTNKIADKPFHDTVQSEDADWERCTLRAFLNDEFFNTAFSDLERQSIIETTVTMYDETTNDKVFILNEEQYKNYCNQKNISFSDACWLMDPVQSMFRLEESEVGKSDEFGYGLRVNEECGVRPAIWVSANDFNDITDN